MKLKVIEVTVRARVVRTHAVEEYIIVRGNASHWGESGGQPNVDVPSSVHIYMAWNYTKPGFWD